MEEFRPKLTKKLENLDFYKLKNYIKEWDNNRFLNMKKKHLKQLLKDKNENRIYDYKDEKLGTDFKKKIIGKKWFEKSKIELTQYEYESLDYYEKVSFLIIFNKTYKISVGYSGDTDNCENFYLNIKTLNGIIEEEEYNYECFDSVKEYDYDKILNNDEIENLDFLIKNVIVNLL